MAEKIDLKTGIPAELSAVEITDSRFIDNWNNPIKSLDGRLTFAVQQIIEENTELALQARKYLATRGFVGKNAVEDAKKMVAGHKKAGDKS